MTAKGSPSSTEEYCWSLLRELDRPLSFIGASRSCYALIGGEWVDLERYRRSVLRDPIRRDILRALLRERLEAIRERLSSCPVSRGEALALFEEGIAVKRTLSLLERYGAPVEEDMHEDTRRWLRYGREIS